MSDYLDGNVKNLIIQYTDKPNATGTITAITQEFELVFDLINMFDEAFDLDTAVGKQLDILGKIVGIPREVPFAIPKKYFGFSDNTTATPMADKFLIITTNPMRSKFEIPYTSGQLNDNQYRFFIKAKVIKNYATSRNIDINKLSIQNAIDFLFDGKAYLVDNKNMSMTLYIENTFDFDMLQYIKQLDIIPRPQCVDYSTVSYVDGKTFGWNIDNFTFGSKFTTVANAGYFATKII